MSRPNQRGLAWGRVWTVPLVAGLLAACTAQFPESHMDQVAGTVPGHWSATRQAKAGVDEHWVRRFGDRHLTRLVAEALANNDDMRIASERLYRAEEAAYVAGASARPMAQLAVRGDRQKTQSVGSPFAGSNRFDRYGVNLNIDWEVDIWGRVRAGQSASLAEMQAGSSEYRAARASLAGQVCKAWFALAEAHEQVRLAEKALATRKQTATAVRERFELSMIEDGGSASQLRLAQTDVATAKADVSARMGNRDAARRQLELLLGRYPAGKLSGRVTLPRTPAAPPAGLPSELLLRRPDILATERRYAASGQRVKEARLAAFPSFKLTASGGTATDSLSDILNSNFGVWSLGASATEWLLTGGQIRSEVRSRDSTQREALARLHQTVLGAFGEVEQALAAEHWLARREVETVTAMGLAKEAAQAAEHDYRDGNGDVLTLFLAQSRHIQLDSTYVTLRRLRLENRVDLHLALGGGFRD